MPKIPAPPSPEFLALQKALAGRYSLERELGRGGMGIVYLAREVALDRLVALKLLPPELAVRPGLTDRFLREARTSARLSHPNIVPIHTVDEVDGFVFFAMAFIEGGTLADRMRDRGPPSNAEAVRILREVAWALGYAHLQGVVHRDVKPENILLEEGSGRAMVTDFGIAVLAEEADHEGPVEILGTAEFMSPEQAKGAEVDARSDIYSLGCVGFYALSGRMPFSGPNPAGILGQHLTQPPPLLASVAPQAPPVVAAVIDRCLRKDPDQRFSSGEALAEALSPNTQLERELPLPLRVFIKQTREFESTLAWCGLGLLLFGPPLLAGILAGSTAGAVQAGLVIAILAGIPLVRLGLQARRLLKSGFTVEDATEALLQDVVRRNEEYRYQVGQRVTWVDRGLRWLKRGGFAVAATSLVGGMAFAWPVFAVFSSSSLTALSATLFQEIRHRARGDVMGERWLRFWKGKLGKGFFKLGSLRLARVAPAVSGIHRPTEVAIGLAADRLFEELPKDAQKKLRGLPETVKALEDDAQAMRRQVAELDAVLAEIGDDDPTRAGAEERARVRGSVAATREEARGKLRKAVAALETIRLGLLYMHAGSGTVESMTTELRMAQSLSDDMENLLAGHREVERILQERRKTGMFTIGPVAPDETSGVSSGGSA
jgi:serine/threonine-protein kinase